MKNLIRACVLSFALMASAQSFAQIRITLSPPSLKAEIVPDRPFEDAIWQPGYWSYDATAGSYSWVSGKWVAAPYNGATWIAPHYRFFDGEFHFVPGHWRRM